MGSASESEEGENRLPIPFAGGEVAVIGSLLLGHTAGLRAAWSALKDGEAILILVPDELEPRR